MQGYELHGRRERTVALAVVRAQTELVRGVGSQVGRDRSTREGEEEEERGCSDSGRWSWCCRCTDS